jgi:hypothetical protein
LVEKRPVNKAGLSTIIRTQIKNSVNPPILFFDSQNEVTGCRKNKWRPEAPDTSKIHVRPFGKKNLPAKSAVATDSTLDPRSAYA